MFKTIATLVGAAALGALGYAGYKRYFGSTDTMDCSGAYPWYAPDPIYGCGQQTAHGVITGMQYQSGQWVYQFADGTYAKESAMHAASKAGELTGASLQIL